MHIFAPRKQKSVIQNEKITLLILVVGCNIGVVPQLPG